MPIFAFGHIKITYTDLVLMDEGGCVSDNCRWWFEKEVLVWMKERPATALSTKSSPMMPILIYWRPVVAKTSMEVR